MVYQDWHFQARGQLQNVERRSIPRLDSPWDTNICMKAGRNVLKYQANALGKRRKEYKTK